MPDLALLDLLRTEAHTLLASAAAREPAELARLQAFARACLELTDVGRLALAVIDGGLFAPRRALELAEHIAAATAGAEQPELRSASSAVGQLQASGPLRVGKDGTRTK